VGALVGIQSILRSNRIIDEVDARTKLANHELLYGDRGQLPEGFDDMGGDLVGGDQIHNHYHSTGGSKLLRVAAIAALAAGMGGLGFALPIIIDAFKTEDKPDPPPPVISPEDPQPSIGFLELGKPD